jgi:hypothetical protein
MRVVANATTRLLRRAERISGFARSFAYQSRVKPPQLAVRRLRLKEKTTRTRMGAYRKAYTAALKRARVLE